MIYFIILYILIKVNPEENFFKKNGHTKRYDRKINII